VPFHFVTSFLRAARGLDWFFHQNWEGPLKADRPSSGEPNLAGQMEDPPVLADGKPGFCYARTCDTNKSRFNLPGHFPCPCLLNSRSVRNALPHTPAPYHLPIKKSLSAQAQILVPKSPKHLTHLPALPDSFS
jgi:hypothetical protein